MAKYKRISDAVYAWTSELTRIPQSVVEKLQKANCDDIMEITPPAVGNRVELFYAGQSGEITKRIQQTDKYVVHTDDGEDVTVEEGEFEVVRDDYLPMWGTMWAFNDPCDGWWQTSSKHGSSGMYIKFTPLSKTQFYQDLININSKAWYNSSCTSTQCRATLTYGGNATSELFAGKWTVSSAPTGATTGNIYSKGTCKSDWKRAVFTDTTVSSIAYRPRIIVKLS